MIPKALRRLSSDFRAFLRGPPSTPNGQQIGMNKLACLLLLFVAAGCTGTVSQSDPIKEVIIDGLRRPWSMVFLADDEVLVTEKDGDLVRINLLTNERIPIQGFPANRADSVVIDEARIASGHYPRGIKLGLKLAFNAGLLDVVLDPEFSTNSRVYVSYVAAGEGGTTTTVVGAVLKDNTLRDVQTLLVALPFSDGSYHYGGGMAFGRDGRLYVAVGERLFTEALQPDLPVAQDITDARGVIYRLNSDGTIPDDNPNFGVGAVPGAYAYGVRNSQGIALDPATGELWFTEHGTHQGDELNLLRPGANYGWPIETTGTYRAPDYQASAREGVTYTPPVWYWQHTVAPTGLTFYNGDEFPEWKGDLLVPGLSGGSLWRFRIRDNSVRSAEELFLDQRVRTRKAVEGPDGTIYLLTDEPNGKIIRVRNAARRS